MSRGFYDRCSSSGRAVRVCVPSPGTGESGARARLAFRISAETAIDRLPPPCGKWRSNFATLTAPTLAAVFLARQHRAGFRRRSCVDCQLYAYTMLQPSPASRRTGGRHALTAAFHLKILELQ
jgi:hypothetical protein